MKYLISNFEHEFVEIYKFIIKFLTAISFVTTVATIVVSVTPAIGIDARIIEALPLLGRAVG